MVQAANKKRARESEVPAVEAPRPSSSSSSPKLPPAPAREVVDSFMLCDLTTAPKAIYSKTVATLLPGRSLPQPDIIVEPDNATLVFEVSSKAAAEAMYKRFQNASVYGRRWKVEYHPQAALETGNQATVMDVSLVPAGTAAMVRKALSSVHGFLSVDAGAAAAASGDSDGAEHSEQQLVTKLKATFADEGGAIHARAVLSGRLLGDHGVRMFLQRKR